MTYFVSNNIIYKIVRETAKTLFYKRVKPSKEIRLDNGVLFISMESITFKKYSLENITLEGEEQKILKSKFDQSKVIEESDIERLFFENTRMIRITQYMSNYHLFLDDDSNDLLTKAYILKKFVYSLTTDYIKNQIFNRNDERIKNIYNQELNKFKLFYEQNTNLIINNLEKIIYTICGNFDGNGFNDKLNEVLQLEPVD